MCVCVCACARCFLLRSGEDEEGVSPRSTAHSSVLSSSFFYLLMLLCLSPPPSVPRSSVLQSVGNLRFHLSSLLPPAQLRGFMFACVDAVCMHIFPLVNEASGRTAFFFLNLFFYSSLLPFFIPLLCCQPRVCTVCFLRFCVSFSMRQYLGISRKNYSGFGSSIHKGQ